MIWDNIHWIEKLYIFSSLLNTLGSSIFSFFVYSKNKKSSVNIRYLIMGLTITFWSSFLFLCHIVNSNSVALYLNRILHIGAIFIPITFFHFILEFLNKKKENRNLLIFGYVFGFIISIFLLTTPLLIKDIQPKFWFKRWPVPGKLYPLFLLFFFFYILYSFYLTLKSFKQETGYKKEQIRYVLFGMIVGFGGGATNYPMFYNIPLPPIGNFFIFLYIILYAYATVKYHFLDINIVIKKSTLFAWRVLLPILLFALFVSIGQQVFIKYLPMWLWRVCVVGCGIFLLYYLYNKTIQILKLKDEELEKEKYTYREKLRTYVEDITRAESFEEAATYIVRKVSLIGRIDFCAIARL